MEPLADALSDQVAELKKAIESLPEAQDEKQQAAIDGFNELVRIFEHMSVSTQRFAQRQDEANHE